MNLHEAPDVFVELVQATAAEYAIPEIYVEKDYWVTKALKRLSESEFADQVVFKGGTSLSKGHRLIRRFSEDIDLAANCFGVSANKTKTLLKQAERAMTVDLTYQPKHDRESKGSKFRKTAHAYPAAIDRAEELGVAADAIFLEINAFTVPEPSEPTTHFGVDCRFAGSAIARGPDRPVSAGAVSGRRPTGRAHIVRKDHELSARLLR